jgi:hypothetical protein
MQVVPQAEVGPRTATDEKRVVAVELELLSLVRPGDDFERDAHGLPVAKLRVTRHSPVPEMDSDARIIPGPNAVNKKS